MNGKLCNYIREISAKFSKRDKLGTFLENSIVTDTFQGKMHSSFKCEKCKEELILEDYFTFLDLRIPKEKVIITLYCHKTL